MEALVAAVAFLVFFAGFAALILRGLPPTMDDTWMLETADSRTDEALEALAMELDLVITPRGSLEGERDGVLVTAEPLEDTVRTWRLELTPSFRLPKGQLVRVWEVDGEVHRRVHPEGGDYAWLMEDDALSAAFDAAAAWRPRLERVLALELLDGGLERALEHGLAMCRALDARRLTSARALARRLALDVDPATVDQLAATVGTTRVRVTLPWVDGDHWTVAIRVELPDRFPYGTLIVGKDLGRGRSIELGDLFLDSALHIRTSDPEAVRARLARDAVRGPLLELLNERPGSQLETEALVAVFSEGALDIDARVSELLDLVEAMEP